MDKKQQAEARDLRGECIVCGTAVSGRRRGLCVTDYTRFRTALLQVDVEERDEFEELQIQEGRLLPSRQGQRGGLDDDVFAQSLEEFRRRSRPKNNGRK